MTDLNLESKLSQALHSLNPTQAEAATHIDRAMLILAGAGSGKTKTLTTRLAYLIDEVGIPPSSTLTLTFTNKAAQEMRERALSLLAQNFQAPPLLCTFHRFGLLFLRFHIATLGRNANFVVLDSDDKRAILKSLCKTLPASELDMYISDMKNASLSPSESRACAHSEIYRQMNRIYEEYEAYLLGKNLLDLDDLLVLTYKILSEREDIAQEMSYKYQYIMVDEYQDTNELQSKILKRLCLAHNNLCVVGDDDQSIYGWRGADVRNILNFSQEFEEVKVVKLEQNYRSNEQILDAANALISHNTERLGKVLQSVRGQGEAVKIIKNENETSEAEYIAQEITRLLAQGVCPSKIAVLFRVNALSRSIEESLNRARIPYKLIGAMRFYERAEIKDLLSYLRLIVNPDNDFSFLRIINRPKRGIGKVTQARLENLASLKGLSCLATLQSYPQECAQSIGDKAYKALYKLVENLQRWAEYTDLLDLIDELENKLIFEFSRLDEVDRNANIEEFYGMFRDYVKHNPSAMLVDFLNDLSLSSPTDEDVGESVSCMSIHSAKGLEFEHVYVIGCEEGFFPLVRGRKESDEIQEERRLGYVAFTRAKDFLTLSSVKSRFYRGKRENVRVSRFIREAGLLDSQSAYKSRKDKDEEANEGRVQFAKGMMVRHKLFGVGVIEALDGEGEQCKLQINFGGMRRIILSSFVQVVPQ